MPYSVRGLVHVTNCHTYANSAIRKKKNYIVKPIVTPKDLEGD